MKKICPKCNKVEIPDKKEVKQCADCWFKEKYPQRLKSTDLADLQAYEQDISFEQGEDNNV